MDRLSSCYFCGGALDASLSEYPVVPRDLQPADADGKTVVLCSTCRRKLAGVIEAVVAATDAESSDERSFEGTAFEPSADTAQTTDGSSSEDPTQTTDATSPGDTAQTTDASSAGDPAQTPFDDASDADETSHGSGVSADRDSSETAADPASGPADSPTESEPSDSTERTASASPDSGDTDPELTKLEYNQVMRLLQNRQLPVDRSEIRDVATSAYDIQPSEFDAVIEAAVDRGLIGVENGQFVDP